MDEVSLEDMFGEPPQAGRPAGTPQPKNLATITLDDMGVESDPDAVDADKGFFEKTWENLKQMNEEGKQAFLDDPVEAAYSYPWGAAKSLLGGAVSMGRLAAKGVAGLTAKITGNDFSAGPEAVDKFLESDEKLSKGILYINLSPSNKTEEAFNNLLGIIPEGITAAGDTVFDKTGSALAGAGTQAFLTLLTLKPSAAVKPFESFKRLKTGDRLTAEAAKSAEKVSSTVDELAVTDPEAVQALKDHVTSADPELGELLGKAVDEAKAKNPVDVGIEVAQETEPAKPIGPAYKLEQSEGQLQVVKADGTWKSQPLSDPIAAKLQLEQLNSMAEKNAELKAKAEGLAKASQGVSDSVEQGMKALAELPNAPKVEMSLEEREAARKLANDQYAKQLAEEEAKPVKTFAQRLEEQAKKPSTPEAGKTVPEYEGLRYQVEQRPDGWHAVDQVTGTSLREEGILKKGWPHKANADLEALALNKAEAERLSGNILNTFNIHKSGIEPPGFKLVKGKLEEYYDQIIRTVNPEALGPKARQAASVLAKHIAIQMQRDSTFAHRAAERVGFWNKRAKEVPEFLSKFEAGGKFSDPALQQAADAYRAWNERIFNQDKSLGINYEPAENYLFHVFKDSRSVAEFFKQKFGPKWGNPQFMKERQFGLYSEAVKAGYEPKFTNPEDIMLARQHATDVAEMQVNALREMEKQGVAVKIVSGTDTKPQNWPAREWRAPNGERYWVHDSADAVLQNAFNTKSLWAMPGMVGDAFRSAMFLKNAIVPIKLALSLFHPIHVATIDNATGMVRASKGLLSGTTSPARFVKEMIEAGVYKDLAKETGGQLASLFGAKPVGGNRLLKAYQGKLTDAEITSVDRQALSLMAEGGFIPEMAAQFKNSSIAKLQAAIQKRSATALWHLPFAAISALQKPMFEVWIPSLKIASYLKDVKTALQTDPTLLSNQAKRQLTLRRLAKSVDNRYGEMAYSTLFWNRWVKDLAVANTLSLGWQMGFLREYGGGALDIGQAVKGKGGLKQKVSKSELDRPMFVAYYTAQALAYGGLLTWAMTNEQPKGLNDYIYPRTGEAMANGRAERVNTMFYPREFASIYHHVEKEGLVSGLGHLAASKASGVIGLTSEWARGVNDFGEEIRDPDAPAYKQLQQTLAASLEDLQPISVKAIQDSTSQNKLKSTALKLAGFSPAPKYVTETKTEGLITGTFRKYFSQTQTPYDRAQFSDDRRSLRKAYDNGDSETYGTLLDNMQRKYELTGKETMKLERSLAKGEDPLVSMFGRLTWKQQRKILDQMTEEEREVYLPASNKEHLRYNYEPPESN